MTCFRSRQCSPRAIRRINGLFLIALFGMLITSFSATVSYAATGNKPVVLRALGKPETIEIGRKGKPYLVITEQPLTIPLRGPGRITGYARVGMPTEGLPSRSGILKFSGVPTMPPEMLFDFKPSRSGIYTDGRPGKPSGGRKLTFDIPSGEHKLQVIGSTTDGDPVMVILYYDGPEQPGLPKVITAKLPSAAKTSKKKKSPWQFRGTAGIDIMYNDNILSNSQDYLDEYKEGIRPDAFNHNSNDDLVVSPSLDLEARRTFFPLGQSRFRFKVKRYIYTHNSIKTNTDFNFYVRQYVGKNQSLEFFFHFAPEQYIRELTDRLHYSDRETPIEWKAFKFQRNTWNLTWRQKISKKLSAKVLFEENYRYYNRPFMENDIHAWEIRGNVSYKISKTFTASADYSYEDGNARGIDAVGETLENSNNSDASYERDLYRIGLTIKPKPWKKVLDSIGLSFLFMDYYFTTDKEFSDDVYHVGRQDRFYKATIESTRALTKSIKLKAAVRRTERVVLSPWEGDITTDKDFIQWLYWINVSYRF